MKLFQEYLQPDNSIDVLWNSWIPDYPLFFGPIVEGTKPFITTKTNIGDILVELGLVDSKSWCRKNNWWKELPLGYNEVTFGHKKVKLCILIGDRDGICADTIAGDVQGDQAGSTATPLV